MAQQVSTGVVVSGGVVVVSSGVDVDIHFPSPHVVFGGVVVSGGVEVVSSGVDVDIHFPSPHDVFGGVVVSGGVVDLGDVVTDVGIIVLPVPEDVTPGIPLVGAWFVDVGIIGVVLLVDVVVVGADVSVVPLVEVVLGALVVVGVEDVVLPVNHVDNVDFNVE